MYVLSCRRIVFNMPYCAAWLIRAEGSLEEGRRTESRSAIMSPKMVPCPKPVVTTRLAVFYSNRSMPARVMTAAACTSQSTVMESMSLIRSTRG